MSRPRSYRSLLFFLLGLFLVCAALRAQLPDSPAPPDHPASAMYTLEDLYNRLAFGADGMLRGAGFVEPPTGPRASGRTLNEIMGVAPLADDGSGLGVSQCVAGRTFWSLLTASWGPQVCTAPDIGQESFTPGAGPQAISAGFHDGTGRVSGDPDLVPANIADGVEIFGVNGSAPQASGVATDSQVLAGITYSSDSGASIGTMPDIGQQSFTPGTSDQAISLGFHDGTGTVAGDGDLAAANIADGVQVFGVTGSALLASGAATDAQVLAGISYSRSSGASVGTMPNVGAQSATPGTTPVQILPGFHNGTGSVAGEPNLVSGNVHRGVAIFGVSGDPNVVNTATGDAIAADITAGRRAWVDGVEVVGSNTLTPTCDPPGALNGTRWCDNGDGTVTDLTTGLVWLKDPGCPDLRVGTSWSEQSDGVQPGAQTLASNLWDGATLQYVFFSGDCGLSDGSVEGDWRLPSLSELVALTTDPEGVSFSAPRAFSGVRARLYWSSTSAGADPARAWAMSMLIGLAQDAPKSAGLSVWPVRSAR